MDVARNYSMREALNGSMQRYLEFARMSGMTSSELEHSVPEQMLSTPEMPVEGVSAVKALRIANEQGIPIYTVTQENAAEIIPRLELDYEVINEIWSSVQAGREVTVSQRNIIYNGWTGCGYIIFAPNTGAGAYKISGGARGALLMILIFGGALLVILGVALLTTPFAAFGVYLLVHGVAMMSIGIQVLKNKGAPAYDCILAFGIAYILIIGGAHLKIATKLAKVCKYLYGTTAVGPSVTKLDQKCLGGSIAY